MFQESLKLPDVDGVYWTLATELHFYAIFALVVWRGVNYRRVMWFCSIWGALGAAFLFLHAGPGIVYEFVSPQFCWYFIAGTCFYLIYREGFRWLPAALATICLGFGVHSAWQMQVIHTRDDTQYPVPMWPVGVLIVAFWLVMALVASRRVDGVQWAWLTVAGAMTHPLYLIHEFIGWEIISKLQLVLGLVIVMLAAAWALNRWVDRPGSRLVRRYLTALLFWKAAAPATGPAGPVRGRPGNRREWRPLWDVRVELTNRRVANVRGPGLRSGTTHVLVLALAPACGAWDCRR
jgi:peptidoglycan/LPS O-acetylase OafA/YrhL